MNSLKSLFFIAVLAAAALGVYVSLNRTTESPIPEGMGLSSSAGNSGGVSVTMPDAAQPGGLAPVASIPGPSASGAIAPRSTPLETAGGTAPPFSPTTTAPPYPASSTAPAYPTPAAAAAVSPAVSVSPNGPALTAAAAPPTADNRTVAPAFPAVEGPSFPPSAASAAPAATRNRALQDRAAQIRIESIMQDVQAKVAEHKWADAHALLSSVYGSPDVSPEQSRQLVHLLDQMAGRVVYSREHLLENPYRVQPGDTLERIAEQYGVPPLLLQRINGIRDPNHLTPGSELKVVRGPFSALVDFNNLELTLMVKGRYAGRFSIGKSEDLPRLEGTFAVTKKELYDQPVAGAAYPGGGKPLIDLDDQIKIQGASDLRKVGRTGGRGSICLSDRDMDDVYGILSVGSTVTIQR